MFIAFIYLSHDFYRGILNLVSIRYVGEYTSSFIVSDHDALYLQIFVLSCFYIKLYFYSLLIAKNKILFFTVFISQILLSFNSPTRLAALSPFVVFITYGYYMGYININFRRVLFSVFISPFIFVVLLLSRGSTESASYFQVLSSVVKNMDGEKFFNVLKIALESFKSFEFFVEIVNNQFVHFESGVVRLFFMPISRSLWEDKPESISRIISKNFVPEQYYNGGGSVATIYGDSFINGHVFGVVILMFLVGLFSKLIKNTMSKCTPDNINVKSMVSLFYSLYAFQFLHFFRGFLSEAYWKVILMLIIFFLMYVIQYKVNFVKSR